MKHLLFVASLLVVGCGTAEQRQGTTDRVAGIARGVCVACDTACRLVPGSPQNGRASSGSP